MMRSLESYMQLLNECFWGWVVCAIGHYGMSGHIFSLLVDVMMH